MRKNLKSIGVVLAVIIIIIMSIVKVYNVDIPCRLSYKVYVKYTLFI